MGGVIRNRSQGMFNIVLVEVVGGGGRGVYFRNRTQNVQYKLGRGWGRGEGFLSQELISGCSI